ncbi:VOC family protein [Nocardia terpenica]|uniref:VOC family protein n=1 Tax=Nocardia terpenica TaxID=455432 RepID=A0A6G9Z9G5_9NOCA|nr:VOC family protein [Nocardia terpenica]QIS22104.1 VOC family protein [Nocardia terpenica]
MTDAQLAPEVPFYHVCFAVPDLQAAMDDLTRAVGCRWCDPWDGRLGDDSFTTTFTLAGPPHIELVSATSGPWDSSGGARFDHLGYWTSSITAASKRLSGNGFPEHFTGCPVGQPFIGHHIQSLGARIELFDIAAQPYFLDAVPGSERMPALDENALR